MNGWLPRSRVFLFRFWRRLVGISGSPVHSRRRHITPEAGHALEILGHAIEYLTDEYLHEGGSFSASDPRLEAVQLLMARNREIYFACPEVAGLRERIQSFLYLVQLDACSAQLGPGSP